jgi:putative tricarboxylic transport membrane protein
MLETEFLRSYQLSGGDPLYLFQRPGAMAIVGVMLASLAMTAWGKRKQAKQEAEEEEAIDRIHREATSSTKAGS